MKVNSILAVAAACGTVVLGSGCCCFCAHPNSDSAPWVALYDPSKSIEEQFDASSGMWSAKDGVLTSGKDGAIWTRDDYENFALDFEYKLEPPCWGVEPHDDLRARQEHPDHLQWREGA